MSVMIVKGWLFLFFATCPGSCAMTESEYLASMQPGVDVALAVAAAFSNDCLRVLHPTVQSEPDQRHTFLFVRALLRGLVKHTGGVPLLTVTSISFGAFNDYHQHPHETCYKPLEIFVTSDVTRQEFSELCENFPVASSIWLSTVRTPFSDFEFFSNISLPFNIHLLAVSPPVDLTGRRLLRELYRVQRNRPLKIVEVGYWCPQTGLSIETTSIYHRRAQMDGITFKTGSIQNFPITTFERQPDGTYDLNGFFGMIWKELEELANFTSINIQSIDNSTGIQDSVTKEWNGLVGMLVRKEIDVIVSELNINQERTEVVDFSNPLLKTRYQIYFRQPGYNLAWTAVFQPFHVYLWLALLGWMLAGALALVVCFKGTKEFQAPSDLSIQPSRTIFFMLQTMCQQGYFQVPQSYSCRIVFLISYIMSAIIIPSYSASLISSLTAQVPNRPFDSLQQMLDYKEYKLMLVRNSAEYAHFAKSSVDVYRRVFDQLVPKDNKTAPNYTAEFLRQICQKPYAIFGVESTLSIRLAELENAVPNCQIIKFSQALSIVYQSIGFRKNDPYTGVLDFHIGRMVDVGIIGRLLRAVWPLTSNTHTFADFKQVSTNEVFQIFLLLLIGIVLATIVLIIEILTSSSRRDKPNNGKKEHLGWIQPQHNHFW